LNDSTISSYSFFTSSYLIWILLFKISFSLSSSIYVAYFFSKIPFSISAFSASSFILIFSYSILFLFCLYSCNSFWTFKNSSFYLSPWIIFSFTCAILSNKCFFYSLSSFSFISWFFNYSSNSFLFSSVIYFIFIIFSVSWRYFSSTFSLSSIIFYIT